MLLPLADWPQRAPDLGIAGLRLRPLRDADATHWYAYLRDDNVTGHTSWQLDGPDALAPLIRGYADPAASHCVRLAIVEADDRLIGTIGFNEITPGARRAEIAYDLAPSHWRRGIASRACEAMTAWALQTLGPDAGAGHGAGHQYRLGRRAGTLPFPPRRAAAPLPAGARRAAPFLDVRAHLAARAGRRRMRLARLSVPVGPALPGRDPLFPREP